MSFQCRTSDGGKPDRRRRAALWRRIRSPPIATLTIDPHPTLTRLDTTDPDDFPTPDGTATRDYTHVCDLADAHVLALQHLLGGGDSLELNLGTGRAQSVLEVIQAVEKVSGRTVPVVRSPRREGDPPELVADPAKVGEVLKWKPRFTDLHEIIQTAWDWHSHHSKKIG